MRKGISYSEAGKLGALASTKTHKKKKQERIKQYNLDPTVCIYCNKSLSYEKRNNKFCNHSCSASFNNLEKIRNGFLRKKECFVCGKITSNIKYCSHKCHRKFEWDKRKEIIKITGKITSKRVGIRYLKEIRGNKCEICNLKKWNNKDITMVMDHIDGNADNNIVTNLRLICPNCDSQTITYKGRNIGNGRYSRRKRYAKEKNILKIKIPNLHK